MQGSGFRDAMIRELILANSVPAVDTELQWIGNNGIESDLAWANTLYTPVYGDKITLRFRGHNSTLAFLFGSRASTSYNGYTLISNSNQGYVAYGGTTVNESRIKSTTSEWHTLVMSPDGVYLDDVEIPYSSNQEDGVVALALGAVWQPNNQIDARQPIADYSLLKVDKEDGIPVLDVVGVIRADGVVCFKNKVNGDYFEAEKGEFLAGDPISEVDGYQLHLMMVQGGEVIE